eukprot:1157939-Pelagomonas_calceolata.AAC.4
MPGIVHPCQEPMGHVCDRHRGWKRLCMRGKKGGQDAFMQKICNYGVGRPKAVGERGETSNTPDVPGASGCSTA